METDRLVEDFTARREPGLERAYAEWAREFLAVALHVLGNASRAEDCVHDALLRVWRTPNRIHGDRRALKAYLVSCIRNEAISQLRSEQRRAAREARSVRLEVVPPADFPVADPVEARRLRAALGRLPQEQRLVLDLAYYGNKTHAQIASELGAPLGTVKSRIATALRKLHAELADEDEALP